MDQPSLTTSAPDLTPLQRQLPKAYRINRYRLGTEWEAEVEFPSDIYSVEIDEPGGANVLFKLRKQRSSGRYRLLHRLDLEVLARFERIVICYTFTCAREGAMQWTGILAEGRDQQRRCIVPATLTGIPGTTRVTTVAVVELDTEQFTHESLFLAFDLSEAPSHVEVADFHLEAFGNDWLRSLPSIPAPIRRVATEPASPPQPPDHAPAADPGAVAGAAADPADPADYFIGTRKSILAAAETAAAEHRTPYYELLIDAVQMTNDLRILTEVARTLQRIDVARSGSVPAVEGPLISVVMPVYNRPDMVKEAVSSVLAQTYRNLELLICDDGSDNSTPASLASLADTRIRVFRHPSRRGAAAARNTCLREAAGSYVAYLDSDNLWHPRFLEVMLEGQQRWPGNVTSYASFFDLQTDAAGRNFLRDARIRSFHMEDQIDAPFVDLNSFMHRREIVDGFHGFDERLIRRQDYDLIFRYCWAREPRHFPYALNLYRRDARLPQITQFHGADRSASETIREKVALYYKAGSPASFPTWLKKVTVVSWDMSRNHFAKAYNVAEALSRHLEVQLISFQFFEVPIFQPYAGASPAFEIRPFAGGELPDFFDRLSQATDAVNGDVIYAVKPRLPSLGLALLANARTGKPIFLEANDLETVVASPKAGDRHIALPLSVLNERAEEARVPYADIWSQVMEGCAHAIPTMFAHNINLNIHYGRRCLTMRNVKDETVYDPSAFDREAVRAELGFRPEDRVILFGGLVRRHKGVFELAELVERLGGPYRLLVATSRDTPDLRELTRRTSERITTLPPQPPAKMAALNLAADLVVLWLDPAVPASHYQMPYKLTDAIAMGTPVIASPVSDLAAFGERELLWTVPFGDFERLAATVRRIFDDDAERTRRCERARRVFLREFSYNSVPAAFALAASMVESPRRIYPVATEFAGALADLVERLK